MRELPAVSEDFTRKQLFFRLKFYKLKPKYMHRMDKEDLISYISKYETLNTRSIEDTDHE